MKKERNFEVWLKNYLKTELSMADFAISKLEKEAANSKTPLHHVVMENGIMNIEEIYKKATEVLVHETTYFDNFKLDPDNKILSKRTMEKFNAIPLEIDQANKKIKIAISNPSNLLALDEIRRESKLNPVPVFAVHSQILDILHDNANDLNGILETMTAGNFEIEQEKEPETTSAENTEEPMIVKVVNSIFQEAITHNASDIHIEPLENVIRVRFRIDGMLITKINNLDKSLLAPIISRIKVLSGMDISESRRPQDGNFRMKDGGNVVDFRVSTMSTHYGEKAVLRVTVRNSKGMNLEGIGFNDEERAIVEDILQKPYGLVLVTGPTGSGKTTTLYGMLAHVNNPNRNIITIEDPIERDIAGVNQTAVNQKADQTFSSGLKTSLRQDPDIIMVGEVRDKETAETTIQAAMTGHLVLSTLHTNDSTGSISRLKDMGIDNYKIPSSLVGVIAQRLIRLNCAECTTEYQPSKVELELIKTFSPETEIPEGIMFQKGKGCKHCNQTGYAGRQPIFEILILDDEIKEDVLINKSANKLRETAKLKGMKTMQTSGVEKILAGKSTVEELKRVIFVM